MRAQSGHCFCHGHGCPSFCEEEIYGGLMQMLSALSGEHKMHDRLPEIRKMLFSRSTKILLIMVYRHISPILSCTFYYSYNLCQPPMMCACVTLVLCTRVTSSMW